jgi:UTP:GlnB (protein PII) uridylyltransferase
MQALCPSRSKEIQTRLGIREVRPRHVTTENTVLEMTGTDRPGLMSELSAVLLELGCTVTSAVAWTHNTRVASIIQVQDGFNGGPITDSARLAHMEAQLENVVEAHHVNGERRSVRLTAPVAGHTHTERRLHQLMYADRDYERCHGCDGGDKHKKCCDGTHATIESCEEKGYSVVNVKSRDRPKLLFDTLCALTDMEYEVFHAVVASKGSMADQVLPINFSKNKK